MFRRVMSRRTRNEWDCSMAALYYAAFAVVYAGFLFHHSDVPQLLGRYSVSYVVFLLILAAGFLLPAALSRVAAKRGPKVLALMLAPAGILVVGLYVASALHYYYTETHDFDPFLQAPAPVPAVMTKPSGAFRILALGGSTTREVKLAEADRYPRLLQDRLRRDYASNGIEVFNAGMDWFTAKHSLINYVTNLRDWRPDVAILMHGGNDLCRSFSDPAAAVGPYNRLWSHFYGPSINGANPPTFERNLFVHAAPYWFSDLKGLNLSERDVPLDRFVSLPDFRRNLTYLVHYLKSDGVQVVLLTEPSLYKASMTAQERAVLWLGRDLCKEPAGFLRYTYPSPLSMGAAMAAFNAATKEIAASEQVTLIDVAAGVAKTLDNFADDVHYRQAGAHRVADLVAEGFEKTGLLRAAR